MAKKRKVLFVDRKNDLQSQIAEYFLEKDHGVLYESYSAAPMWDMVDCDLLISMLSLGHDIRRHFSKSFEAIKDIEYDYLVILDDLEEGDLDRVPKHKRVIRKKFPCRADFKATDDFELDECYKALIEEIRAWLKDTFVTYASADAASE